MENFKLMATLQVSLFIYLAVGYYLRRKKMISDEARLGISDLLLNVLLPCMVFESFNMEITPEQLISASSILLISLLVCLVSYILGQFIYRPFPDSKQKILRYGTLVPNSVFAGLPIVRSAFGPLGLFYASVFIIPIRIFMWSAGISLFTDSDLKSKLKSVLLNPGIIAVVLGLIRLFLKVPSTFVDTAISKMGDCTTSLSMMCVGMVLADIDLRSVFDPVCFFASFVRLILLPSLLLVALKLMGFDELSIGASVILTGMPFGSTTALLAQRYGADSEFASKCVFITTVLSLFTIPAISIFI